MNETEHYLRTVLKSRDERLRASLEELGAYEEYQRFLPRLSSQYEDELRTRILEHAIQIAALNHQLADMRLSMLKGTKETLEILETPC